MLSEIDVVTKSLQSRGHTLAACREVLDALIECVAEEGGILSPHCIGANWERGISHLTHPS